jgi:hypothetical protein
MARAANDPAKEPANEREHHGPAAGHHTVHAAKDAATGQRGQAEPQADGANTRCPVAWCPICLTVTTVSPLKPELVEHLLKAGTEMLLALRAVVDARAEEMTEEKGGASSTRLEKIELD